MFLRSLALVALFLVSSAALARPPMETNQLVDGSGTPIGTASNPLYTSGGGGGGSVTQGTSPWVISGNSTEHSPTNPLYSTIVNFPSTAAGSVGSLMMNVQGHPNGIPQNVFGGQYNATLPTLSSGAPAYLALDANGRAILSPTSSVAVSANASPNNSGNPLFVSVNNFPTTSAGSSAAIGLAVQGVTGGVPQAAVQQGSALAAVGITPAITQSGTAVVGKASQGNLYSAYAVNTTATAGYLACINATAAPAAGAAIAPIDVQTLAGAIGATASINYGAGPPNAYSVGIVCLITTSLTTYTAGGASYLQARVR